MKEFVLLAAAAVAALGYLPEFGAARPTVLRGGDARFPVARTQTTRVSAACNPNYSPCVPYARDVDCAGGRGNGPAYVAGPVEVIGADVYGLDRDGNGVGCEGG